MGWGLERKLIWGLRALSNVPPPAPPCTKAGQDYEQGADDRGMEAKSASLGLCFLNCRMALIIVLASSYCLRTCRTLCMVPAMS